MDSNETLREARRLLEELNTLKRQLGESRLDLGDEELLRRFQDLPAEIRRARRDLEDLAGSATNLYSQLRNVTEEFRGQVTTMGKVRGAFRQLEEAAQSLKLDEQSISNLNSDQLKKLQDKIAKSKAFLVQEAESLQNNNSIAADLQNQVDALRQQGAQQDFINEYVSDYLKVVTTLTDEQKALLSTYHDQEGVLDGINKAVEKRLEKEKELNKIMGVGGAIVEGTSTLMKKLGLNSNAFADSINDARTAMRETAEAIRSGEKRGGRLTVLMAGLGPLAKGLGRSLTDPLAVFEKILDAFFEVNKASVEFQRLTGQNATYVSNLNTRFATSVDFLKTASELTQQIGYNATSIFGPDELAAIAEAKNLLGLTAEEAQGLALQSKVVGTTVDSFQDSVLAGVSATNKLTKSAVAPGVVLKDVLKTSKSISLSLGNNPESLGKAATAARAFGYELSQVDQIASSLLDFESSIEAELEAQLLTGKHINLAKAREYAMTNDLAALSEELAKNGATAAEFANMNRFAQEALAKSLGMSREDLAKSIMLQESSKNLTDEQRAAVLGVTKEQLQQADVQERIQKSIDKLAQSFAPILDSLVPIVDVLGAALNIVSLMVLPFTTITSAASSLSKGLGVVVGLLTAAALAALFLNGSLTLGTGVAIATAAALTGYGIMQYQQSKAKSIDDGVISPEGGLVVSGPEGSIQLNPNDSVVAGTDLFTKSNQTALPASTTLPSIDLSPLLAEFQAMKQILTSIRDKEGNVYLDTDLVGKALVIGSTSI